MGTANFGIAGLDWQQRVNWDRLREYRIERARAMMKKFYSQGGVEISDAGMESEFGDRPVFGLDQQVKIMDRSKGKSDVDTWLGNIGEFMKSVGTIPEVPDAKAYIDDTFMKRVAADATLKAMATKAMTMMAPQQPEELRITRRRRLSAPIPLCNAMIIAAPADRRRHRPDPPPD